jgi:hypothetical protein
MGHARYEQGVTDLPWPAINVAQRLVQAGSNRTEAPKRAQRDPRLGACQADNLADRPNLAMFLTIGTHHPTRTAPDNRRVAGVWQPSSLGSHAHDAARRARQAPNTNGPRGESRRRARKGRSWVDGEPCDDEVKPDRLGVVISGWLIKTWITLRNCDEVADRLNNSGWLRVVKCRY